ISRNNAGTLTKIDISSPPAAPQAPEGVAVVSALATQIQASPQSPPRAAVLGVNRQQPRYTAERPVVSLVPLDSPRARAILAASDEVAQQPGLAEELLNLLSSSLWRA